MGTLASELGPHVERLTGEPRVYIDANLPAGVVRFMRERLGWNVLYVVEHDELRRAADTEHYRLTRQFHRTLISLDRDFLDARRFPMAESGGVIILAAPDEHGLTRELARIDQAFFRPGRTSGAAPLVGQKIDIHPDWSPPGASTRRHTPKRRGT